MNLRFLVRMPNSDISPARFEVTFDAPDEVHAKATAEAYVRQLMPCVIGGAVLDLGNHLECELSITPGLEGVEYDWTEARQRMAI